MPVISRRKANPTSARDAFENWQPDRCRNGLAIVEKFIESQNRISWSKPAGAFSGFLAVEGMTDSTAFAKRLLLEAKVGVAPGIAFGSDGESYIRVCFASTEATVGEALARVHSFVMNRGAK